MLRILIVDDEPKVRRGLEKIIAKRRGEFDVAGKCSSAEECMDFLRNDVVDVIITDIRMPETTGLELIKYCRNRNPNIAFIVLSGYGEFAYAQEAMRHNVSRYLLKPAKESEIFEALEEVRESLVGNGEENKYQDSYLYMLIKSTSEEEQAECLSRIDIAETDIPYYVVLFAFDSVFPVAPREGDAIQREIALVEGNISRGIKIKWFHFFKKQLVAVVSDATLSAMEPISKLYTQKTSCGVTIGVSEVAQAKSELREKYFQSLVAAKYHIYDTEEVVLFYNKNSMGSNVPYPKELIEKITNALGAMSEDYLVEYITELIRYYQASRCNILSLKAHLLRLLENVLKIAEQAGIDRGECKELSDLLNDIEEIRSMEQLETLLKYTLVSLAQQMVDMGTIKNKAKIQEIILYINNNYHRDISLDDIAEFIGLSPGYVSQYFKSETGENFVEHLTALRIDEAKLRLKNTNERVYKIAHSVGYSDAKYFTTLFKQLVGVTPGEYRRFVE